ncbi:hypothetical protein J7J00_26825 [Bacillus sp. ISL-4]|uniref:hypothetical protein n=1 Tax=Bacillus sp. ISL-4 TaxID=2819125 RepID=UPI001BE71A52|nr:hypothetical protein [Bacillus sp. ISL-4]MBT2669004.1 hypothetical protein [Bacillus sp. ISL-4]MBT2671349.1 hypothetical protein [Streptomyces sp. ISL-14]
MCKELVLKNEFAQVSVQIDYSSNGVRLKIMDIRTKRVIYLDPLELESLAWCEHKDLHPILDPSISRWKGIGSSAVEPVLNYKL